MVGTIGKRALAISAAVSLAVAGMAVVQIPSLGHHFACSVGSTDYQVHVFEHTKQNTTQSGIADDICWKPSQKYDEHFVWNSAIDDIGETGNMHDKVTSVSITARGPNSHLCIWWYEDEFRQDYLTWMWAQQGMQDGHAEVLHNDTYDSLRLKKVNLSTCLAGP